VIEINEFHSKLEDLMTTEELFFDSTPGFGSFYKKYLSHAIAHPAKMNTKLLNFLIEQFTKEGDTVLDPMCGSGSTGVVAALHGRNAVQVDIEKKFVDWAEEASKKVESQETLTRKGRIKNILGDSRKLSELLKNVDVIVTSPPFASTTIKKKFKSEEELESFAKGQYVYKHGRSLEATKRFIKKSWKGYPDSPSNIGNLPHGNVDAVITSPPYSESHVGDNQRYLSGQLSEEENKQIARSLESPNRYGYSKNTHNIGNLAHGNVDTIITSPPYGEAQDGHGIAKEGYRGKKHSPTDLVGNRSYMPQKFESEQNISKLKYDAVITSPPYAETYVGGGDSEKRKERLVKAGHDPKDFLGGKARNAVLKHYPKVDAVITSPPYAETKSFQDLEFMEKTAKEQSEKVKKGEIKGHYMTEKARKKVFQKMQEGKIQSEENIGNLSFVDAVITSPPYEEGLGHDPGKKKVTDLGIIRPEYNFQNPNQIGSMKKETYLEAMLQVYREMYAVLKPQGKAVIVIKPFIRNKKVVDLPYHTWLLLEKVGFKLVKLFKLKLKNVSFWRILYHKRYPSVPTIKHEWILICEKV